MGGVSDKFIGPHLFMECAYHYNKLDMINGFLGSLGITGMRGKSGGVLRMTLMGIMIGSLIAAISTCVRKNFPNEKRMENLTISHYHGRMFVA
jgi:hypothetical protein